MNGGRNEWRIERMRRPSESRLRSLSRNRLLTNIHYSTATATLACPASYGDFLGVEGGGTGSEETFTGGLLGEEVGGHYFNAS
jgi:hypothetical protein